MTTNQRRPKSNQLGDSHHTDSQASDQAQVSSSSSTDGLDGWTEESDRQEFFLPVSGFVWLYPEEVRVTNHPAFQRLGRVYQLGQTYLVYRGATHKRLEHAIGTLQLAQRIINALEKTGKKAKQHSPCGASLTLHERRFVRLGALLHDIGHVAAGHTLEDELHLIGKHDADQRIDLLFDGGFWADENEKTLGELINEEFTKYVPPDLRDFSASMIVRMLIRKHPKDAEEDAYQEQYNLLKTSPALRLNVCRDIIGNTICADLLDYLHRDWYHIGKPRPLDERILQYMEIRGEDSRTPSSKDRFVVSLGRRPKIRTDAVSAILDLLEWRYQLAEIVLFHRTKLAASAMLDRAFYELYNGDTSKLEEMLLPLTD